jgi:hypothetical protein
MMAILLSSKDQVDQAIREFKLKVEAETGEKLGGLRTDHGGEFNSNNFT